jgi:hypothetical protein
VEGRAQAGLEVEQHGADVDKVPGRALRLPVASELDRPSNKLIYRRVRSGVLVAGGQGWSLLSQF